MNETTRNFLEVFSNLPPWTLPAPVYRAYYDDQGRVIEYSQLDKPGNYIDVTPEILRDQPLARVVDGKINIIEPSLVTKKLIPNQDHGTACHANDVCVTVPQDHEHVKWSKKTYEPY